jgi:hypothetical protein
VLLGSQRLPDSEGSSARTRFSESRFFLHATEKEWRVEPWFVVGGVASLIRAAASGLVLASAVSAMYLALVGVASIAAIFSRKKARRRAALKVLRMLLPSRRR